MREYPKLTIDDALARVVLPGWAERVRAEPILDHNGEPAIDVVVVVRSGAPDALADGAALNETAVRLHDALLGVDVALWPFVRFISADDLEAA